MITIKQGLSHLYYSTISASLGSCTTLIRVEELNKSSSAEGMDHLMGDLQLGVSDALGVSLSEVCAWYFQDSDEGDECEVDQNLVEEHNYGDMIENHIRSGRYCTEDIDGVPYVLYRDDTF
jgi:hypothetical protein